MSDHERLRSSFGAAATAYAEHRPGYAPDAIRWALAAAPGSRVLDLGAGTGKLTAGLVALGANVVAVEPDGEMLAELHRQLPDVHALAGSAETIPLPDGAVDAVVCGNALHWFDLEVAGPEIARVLAPGGTLAGLWNLLDDRVDWVAGLVDAAGPEAVGPRDTVDSWLAVTAAMLPDAEQALFDHAQPRDAQSLVATLCTRAGVLVLPEAERAEFRARVADYLDRRPETARVEFALPMRTGVLRTRAFG